jgi:RNA polymerase sigma-70 factor (ECF subfamily)
MMWLFAVLSTLPDGDRGQAEDADRLARVADGDGTALAALYDRHVRTVYSMAMRVLRDEADAEDVVQEVFAQVWRQASRYDERRGTVVAWLLNMSRTRAIDRLRARRTRPQAVASARQEAMDDRIAPSVDPVDALTADRDAARVRRALEQLPMLQRLALELAYFEGLTQSEIADRLEEPLGTVKTRIRLGLFKLRDALSGDAAGGAA